MKSKEPPDFATVKKRYFRRKRLRRLAIVCVIFAAVAIIFMVANAMVLPSRQLIVEPIEAIEVDQQAIAATLADVLAIETIADADGAKIDPEPFQRLHALLEQRFPKVHEQLEVTRFGEWSLLYRWPGRNESLDPILLMSHLDVVPIPSASVAQWTGGDASARIDDRFIWGRGALDVKSGVVGMLAAAEHLLGQGHQPERTIYFAMGHDEEVGGFAGNRQIAKHFRQARKRFAFVLDEGGAILTGIIPGVQQPVAFIAIAEKRYAELTITATGEGGHSSMPGKSAIVNLAETIHRIDQHPMPTQMTYPTATLFDFLGPEMPLLPRTVIANRFLLEPLLTYQLSKGPSTNAVVRTTINATQLSSGSAANQNATNAQATLNVRLLPGDSAADVRRHILKITDDIRQHHHGSGEPTRAISCTFEPPTHDDLISTTDCAEFETLQKTIHQVFPDVVVAAGLTSVSTDSAWYQPLCKKIYRFIPMRVKQEDVNRIHGIDERIEIDNMAEIVRFYIQLMQNAG